MNKDEKLEIIESIESDETNVFDYREIEIEIEDDFLDAGNLEVSELVDNGIKYVDYFYDNREKINQYLVQHLEEMDVDLEEQDDLSKLVGVPRIRMIDETLFTYEFERSKLNMILTLEVNVLETGYELSYVTIDD